MGTHEQLLTRKQLAEQLQVCTKTVHRMIQDGRLPQPVRLGTRTHRWRRRDLQHLFSEATAA